MLRIVTVRIFKDFFWGQVSKIIVFTSDELNILEQMLQAVVGDELNLQDPVNTAYCKIGMALNRAWAKHEKFKILSWVKDLKNPVTDQELMLQTVILSLSDSEVYECPIDILRHMDAHTVKLARDLIEISKDESVLELIKEEAIEIDKSYDQSTKHIFFDKTYGMVRIGGTDVNSVAVSYEKYGELRSKARLRFLRDRIIRRLKNAITVPDLSSYLTCERRSSQVLLGLMTSTQLSRVYNPLSTLDRYFQSALLHLVDPEVYFVTTDIIANFTSEDIDSFFRILSMIDSLEVQGALVALAQDAKNLVSRKYGYITEVRERYNICITVNKKGLRASIGISKFGQRRAMMRACFIRDRIMYDAAKSGFPKIMIPLTGLTLVEKTHRGQTSLNLIYQWKPAGKNFYACITRRCAQGFVKAFNLMKEDLENIGVEIEEDFMYTIRPTQDQFDRYHDEILDLPSPFI